MLLKETIGREVREVSLDAGSFFKRIESNGLLLREAWVLRQDLISRYRRGARLVDCYRLLDDIAVAKRSILGFCRSNRLYKADYERVSLKLRRLQSMYAFLANCDDLEMVCDKLGLRGFAKSSFLDFSNSEKFSYLSSHFGLKQNLHLRLRNYTNKQELNFVQAYRKLSIDLTNRKFKYSSNFEPSELAKRQLEHWLASRKYVSVELEFFSMLSIDDWSKLLKDSKPRCVDIKFVRDGSLDASETDYGLEYGVECVFTTTESNYKEDVADVIKYIKKYDSEAATDKQCGMHVHFDFKDDSSRKAYSFADKLQAALPLLSAIVPKSRRTNRYCQLGVQKLRYGSSRYYAVNKLAYAKHKTIELRLHGGTTDAVKICNWIEICLSVKALSLAKINKAMAFDTVEAKSSGLGLSTALVAYCKERAEKFI